ncbi:hypothetical protein, partial [Flexivirga caeni]|uniref:hypothetical protein n=1 Tax=Flexivirga caeni TaxID=2294115 RepID=UPI001C6551F7
LAAYMIARVDPEWYRSDGSRVIDALRSTIETGDAEHNASLRLLTLSCMASISALVSSESGKMHFLDMIAAIAPDKSAMSDLFASDPASVLNAAVILAQSGIDDVIGSDLIESFSRLGMINKDIYISAFALRLSFLSSRTEFSDAEIAVEYLSQWLAQAKPHRANMATTCAVVGALRQHHLVWGLPNGAFPIVESEINEIQSAVRQLGRGFDTLWEAACALDALLLVSQSYGFFCTVSEIGAAVDQLRTGLKAAQEFRIRADIARFRVLCWCLGCSIAIFLLFAVFGWIWNQFGVSATLALLGAGLTTALVVVGTRLTKEIHRWKAFTKSIRSF